MLSAAFFDGKKHHIYGSYVIIITVDNIECLCYNMYYYVVLCNFLYNDKFTNEMKGVHL